MNVRRVLLSCLLSSSCEESANDLQIIYPQWRLNEEIVLFRITSPIGFPGQVHYLPIQFIVRANIVARFCYSIVQIRPGYMKITADGNFAVNIRYHANL